MLLKVYRPMSGDMSNLLAYDAERRHTTLIPVACSLGQDLIASMHGAVVGYFPAEIGTLHGEGQDSRFIPDPNGTIIWIDASRQILPSIF